MDMLDLVRLLPPETAHKLAIWALKNGLGPYIEHPPGLGFKFLGKHVQNPIGLAAGADKKAEALPGWAHMGFGIVEVGTITMKGRPGNPTPRVWRLKDLKNSMVNWMGLPGPGHEVVINNLKKFNESTERKNLLVGASIASPDNKTEDFYELAYRTKHYVDYLTLNASCPNVKHGDGNKNSDQFSLVKESAAKVSSQLALIKDAAPNLPVLVKLGPTKDKESLEWMVKSSLDAGADGFVATNTLPYENRHLAYNLNIKWPTNSKGEFVGGFSGQKLLPIACWMVREIREMVGPDKPIIGVGGIQSDLGALQMMHAGANAIQLYTGLIYKGPALISDIGKTLALNI